MKKKGYLAVLFFCLSLVLPAQEFSLLTDTTSSYAGCVCLKNLPSNKHSKNALQVFLLQEEENKTPIPIIGNWTQEATILYFCPLIPFNAQLIYQAQFPAVPSFTFQPTAPSNYIATQLLHIYPSRIQLPENVLKLYLHFSAPMSEGNAYQYIELKKENGEIIKSPFLELQPLLWNKDRTRLTIWFDPGRVKRELLRNQKLGAPLEKDTHYTLHISKAWQDENSYPLDQSYTKKIEVIQADRTMPTAIDWKIISPIANTKEPLVVHFGEALDHALATKSISVHTNEDQQIDGVVTINNSEKEWQFTPSNNWISTSYSIKINSALEDLAGNNLNRLFDTDLDLKQEVSENLPFYYRYFSIE